MTITWKEYMAWTHETAMRRSTAGTDDRERAELLEIWGLGLGGELAEFLREVLCFDEDEERDVVTDVLTQKAVEEVGDLLYYVARLYVDTSNERGDDPFKEVDAHLDDVVGCVGDVIECVKKALRREGRPGLLRLSLPEVHHVHVGGEFRPGRRAEFGRLLDHALSAIETWLEVHGCSLSAACEVNQEKLRRRKAAGTISAQGERLGEMFNDKISTVSSAIGTVGTTMAIPIGPSDTDIGTIPVPRVSEPDAGIPDPKRSG